MFVNIEIERLRKKLTKAEMADELGIHQNTLSDWISQRTPIPADGMRALLKLFQHASLDYLLKGRYEQLGLRKP